MNEVAPGIPFIHRQHPQGQDGFMENGYFKLAAHFKWALKQVSYQYR
jgi:hypothetical protein